MPDTPPSPPPLPPRPRRADVPGLRSLPTIVAGVVVVAALYLGREVLIPITLAVLLSFVLAPVVGALRRLYLGRVPAVLLAAVLALGVAVVAAGLIASQLAELAADAPFYATTIEQKFQTVRGATIDRATALLDRVTEHLGTRPEQGAPAEQAANGGAGQPAPPLPVQVRQPEPTPLELARNVLLPVMSPLATAAIVFVVAVFVLLQREDLRDRMIRLVGATDLHRTTTALDDAARRLSRYFLTQLVVNTAYGTLNAVVLYLLDVPGALLWGILAGLMRYVPFVGVFIAALPPILLAAAVDPGWTMTLGVILLYLVGEGLMAQVVEPLAFGHSTGLSPVAVVVAAIFWSWLWGPVGLLLAMPLTLCLVVLGRHVERLAFLDVLLGDRPALSPAENFYQRMLASDPDEALDNAEQLLKERPLSAYYDEVVMRGLLLAAADAERGSLPPERIATVRDATRIVVAELGEQHHEDAPPDAPATEEGAEKEPTGIARLAAAEEQVSPRPPHGWEAARAVLCVAGRGPLDELAALMLAQLLCKHGLDAEMVPHAAVSRDGLARLEVEGVAMVCLSYLEISGSPAHLRYLLRRLRQRLPQAPILVGAWPEDDPALVDPALQATIGADRYAGSLRDAVKACLEAAREAGAAQPALAEAAGAAR